MSRKFPARKSRPPVCIQRPLYGTRHSFTGTARHRDLASRASRAAETGADQNILDGPGRSGDRARVNSRWFGCECRGMAWHGSGSDSLGLSAAINAVIRSCARPNTKHQAPTLSRPGPPFRPRGCCASWVLRYAADGSGLRDHSYILRKQRHVTKSTSLRPAMTDDRTTVRTKPLTSPA